MKLVLRYVFLYIYMYVCMYVYILCRYIIKHKKPSDELLLQILEPITNALNDLEELENDDGPFQQHVQVRVYMHISYIHLYMCL